MSTSNVKGRGGDDGGAGGDKDGGPCRSQYSPPVADGGDCTVDCGGGCSKIGGDGDNIGGCKDRGKERLAQTKAPTAMGGLVVAGGVLRQNQHR